MNTEIFKGKKTYLLGILAVLWATYGGLMGYLDAETAQQMVWGGLTAMALRAGITKQ